MKSLRVKMFSLLIIVLNENLQLDTTKKIKLNAVQMCNPIGYVLSTSTCVVAHECLDKWCYDSQKMYGMFAFF